MEDALKDESITDIFGRIVSYLWAFVIVFVVVLIYLPALALGLVVLAVLIGIPFFEAKTPFKMPERKVVVKKPAPRPVVSTDTIAPQDNRERPTQRQPGSPPRPRELPIASQETVIQKKLRDDFVGVTIK